MPDAGDEITEGFRRVRQTTAIICLNLRSKISDNPSTDSGRSSRKNTEPHLGNTCLATAPVREPGTHHPGHPSLSARLTYHGHLHAQLDHTFEAHAPPFAMRCAFGFAVFHSFSGGVAPRCGLVWCR